MRAPAASVKQTGHDAYRDHKAPGIVGGASSLAVNPPRPLACGLRIIDDYSFLLNGFRSVNSVSHCSIFIFPSQYLFAIGLPVIFSLRRSTSPILSCNPKQLDSSNLTHYGPHRAFTFRGGAFQLTSGPLAAMISRLQSPCPEGQGFSLGLFPLRSPLLRESSLLSLVRLMICLSSAGTLA